MYTALPIIDLRAYCRVLDIDHYHPDADGPAAAIDKPIAEATICEKCGQRCTYVAYVCIMPHDHVRIAACWPCNRGELF